MLVNSHEYLLLFLPITVLVFYWLKNTSGESRLPVLWLMAATLFFYGYGEPKYLLILLFSVIFNYLAGKALGHTILAPSPRRLFLTCAIMVNITLLGWFKYAGFIVENVNSLFHLSLLHHSTALPIGLSFITFIQITHLVDCYRNPSTINSLLNYSLASSFFPYILAGPIVRPSEIAAQLTAPDKGASFRSLSVGLYLICMGLFKKVVLADQFSQWATAGFDGTGGLNFLYAWMTSLSYTMQIYFDFSGYTDMAIGAAQLFNIKLPINFDSPYKSLDIQDFWRRWHITLGRFLREYLYIPLGGSRVRPGRIYVNLMIIFLVCGIWHGAGWNFIFWGFLHGAAIVVHRFWKNKGKHLPKAAAWFLTFNFVNAAWVLFRAPTWDDALRVLKGMTGLNGITLPEGWASALGFMNSSLIRFQSWKQIMGGSRDGCLWLVGAFVICLAFRNSNYMAKNFKAGWTSLAVVVAGAYAIIHLFKMSEFLYFNF